MKNNLVFLKYKDYLEKILKNSSGEEVFIASEINVSGIILKKLSTIGIIKKVGKKRSKKQYVNTYQVSNYQRHIIEKALGDLYVAKDSI